MLWLMRRYLRWRGFEVVPATLLEAVLTDAVHMNTYVNKSGHLHTVRGRRPDAVKRLDGWLRSLVAALHAPSIMSIRQLKEGR